MSQRGDAAGDVAGGFGGVGRRGHRGLRSAESSGGLLEAELVGNRKDAHGELALGAFAGAQIDDEGFEDALRLDVERRRGCVAEVLAATVEGGDSVVYACLFEDFESGGSCSED